MDISELLSWSQSHIMTQLRQLYIQAAETVCQITQSIHLLRMLV